MFVLATASDLCNTRYMLLLDGIGGCNYFLVINGQPQQGFGGDLTELKGHILVVGPVFQALPQSGEPDLVFQHDAHISCQKATQQCDHRETEEKGVQQLTYNEIQREKKTRDLQKTKKNPGYRHSLIFRTLRSVSIARPRRRDRALSRNPHHVDGVQTLHPGKLARCRLCNSEGKRSTARNGRLAIR